jgi:4-amino-4-deoxy-L-arabinose transferase-like glycosyltransferase
VPRAPRTWAAWLAIGAVVLTTQLIANAVVDTAHLTPDGAHFLDNARAIQRGQGFVTQEDWPAWLNPPRLPTPDPFKEPGYPFAIAALAPFVGGVLPAARWLSLIAGLLTPFATWVLARRLWPDRRVAWIAAAAAAVSPIVIAMSAAVLSEAMFTLLLTLAFAACAGVTLADAALGGLAFGLALLTRGQAMIAIPALVWLLVSRPEGRGRRLALATALAALTLVPYAMWNLRHFGAPIHRELAGMGVWPGADSFRLMLSLDRPPGALAYLTAHPAAFVHFYSNGLVRFLRGTLQHHVLGHFSLLAPLALGVVVGLRKNGRLAPLALYAVPAILLTLAIDWYPRYFECVEPMLAIAVALGVVWAIDRVGDRKWGPLAARHLIVLAAAGALMVAAVRGVQESPSPSAFNRERAAAEADASWLRTRLAPGEAVMAEITAYWAWYADRPAVFPVSSDRNRFEQVMRRLHVRIAALETARLDTLAARFPEHRLPEALVFERADAAHGMTFFRVEPR